MNLPFYIAKRIYQSADRDIKVSRSAVVLSILGIGIGLMVMIVSVCVASGFKQEVSSKVMGFGSHIQLQNFRSLTTNTSQPIAVDDDVLHKVRGTEGVVHTQRITYKSGVLKTDDDFKGVVLKGIGTDYDTTFLSKHLVAGRLPLLRDSASTQEILLSKTVSDKMKLQAGDRVYAYFFDGNLRARRFTVAGVYCTYLNEYDDKVVFTDIKNCNRLNGWEEDQCSALEIQVEDPDTMDETALALSKVFNRMTDRYGEGYTVMTVKEMNYEMFAWLDLLDLNVTVILILMIAVACFMVVSGLFIIILERTQFIGIMKAMGADDPMIRKVFLHLSARIVTRGLLAGNLLGVGFVLLQQHTHLIKLDAANYYVEYVPVSLQLGAVVLINILVFAAALTFLLIPSYLVARIDPVKTMRFE